MAIDGTGQFFPKILDGSKRAKCLKDKGLDIPFEWTYSCLITGDGSGGAVTMQIPFGTLNSDVYYIITTIYGRFPTNQDSQLSTHCDRWDNFYNPALTNEQVYLMCMDGIYNGISDRDKEALPLYLGKPRRADPDAGTCILSLATNTESVEYHLIMQGFALKHPLPLASHPNLFL